MQENKNRFVLLCQQVLTCGVVLAFAAPATAVVTLDIVAPAPTPGPVAPGTAAAARQPDAGSLVAAAPVEPTVRAVPVRGVDHRALQALDRQGGAAGLRLAAADTGAGAGDLAALTAPQPVSGLGTVGVTWKPGTDLGTHDISVQVRTRTNGVWSRWQTVPYHEGEGPDPDSAEGRRARPGTDPMYVGAVDDVQMKAVTLTGQTPAGMQLDVVDPGQQTSVAVEKPAIDTAKLPSAKLSSAETLPSADATGTPTAAPSLTVDPSATPSPSVAPSTSVSPSPTDPTASTDPGTTDGTAALSGTPGNVTPKPMIYSRAQWGADERMRDKASLHYGEVHAGFVHHTVNANGYTPAQVPSIIRGIYAFHTQSRGWSDIGYNFLVDRFGRIWEGRYGGVDRPVVGAHTLGYNDYSFAMSAIGNYDIYDGGRGIPSQAMLDAYGRLFAWKLSLHGVNAASMHQWVGKKWLAAINGHRDTGEATACPGRYLYAKLPEIRALAAADQRSFASRQRRADLSGSGWPDLVVRNKTTKRVSIVHTEGQLGFGRPRVAASGWSGMDLVTPVGDVTGDGIPDMMARDHATRVTAIYPGNGQGQFGPATVQFGRRFRTLDQLVGVGDFNGDGENDVVGRKPGTKRLYLFPGTGRGDFGWGRLLASGWTYDLTAAAGDLTGDGHPDLVARTAGRLVLLPGTARGTLGAPVTLPGSWRGFRSIAGFGDVTNDGRADLVALNGKGVAFVFPGTGHGRLGTRLGGFRGFGGVSFLASAGKVTGSGGGDLVGRDASGRLLVFPNNGGRNLGRTTDTGRTFPGADLVLDVGDWNGDGHGDLMIRTDRGDLELFAGTGKGRFAPGVLVAHGFSRVRMLTAVGDITGDGYPDLIGQPGGSMRIYPGNGATGFRRSYVAHRAVSGNLQLGVGLWNGDGSPDSMVRRSDGTVVLYPGNGPGGLTGGTKVLAGAGRYDWMLGVGDADGDGRPDVLARQRSNGTLWLLPGNGNGFGPRRLVGGGFGAYDLAG